MRKRRKARRWQLIESDWHGGHILALCYPDTVITGEDGKPRPVVLNETQRYLYNLREEKLAEVREYVGRDPLDYWNFGDVCHGQRHPEQLMFTDMAAQFAIAYRNARPVVGMADTSIFLMGTGSHSYGEGSAEAILAAGLQKEFPKKRVMALAHGLIAIGDTGVTIDASHHGPGKGGRKWLEGNTARYYLRDRMLEDITIGRKPATLYVRGHHHVDVWETLRWMGHKSHLIVVPSMCGISEYARKVTGSSPVLTNGMYLIEIADGQAMVIPLIESIDVRSKVTI